MHAPAAALLGVALALLLPASAAPADELTGTLKRVKETRIVTIGHRDRSIPFSYIDPRGQPIGYAKPPWTLLVNVETRGGELSRTKRIKLPSP